MISNILFGQTNPIIFGIKLGDDVKQIDKKLLSSKEEHSDGYGYKYKYKDIGKIDTYYVVTNVNNKVIAIYSMSKNKIKKSCFDEVNVIAKNFNSVYKGEYLKQKFGGNKGYYGKLSGLELNLDCYGNNDELSFTIQHIELYRNAYDLKKELESVQRKNKLKEIPLDKKYTF
jgi:hypothetical protein